MQTFSFKPWAAILLLALATGGIGLRAQSVIFPQAQQPGAAVLTGQDGRYILSNDLFRATFLRQGSSLTFGGCPELDLEAGTELFAVRLGDGSKTVKASEMKLVGEVRQLTYAADAAAVKGAKRFAGRALEADFTYGDLALTWRAVLRDGSHYLRTELVLTAKKDVKMHSVLPMTYRVNVQQAGSAPRIVGNTRGAVLASDKIFAGLETPTGINTAGEGDDMSAFVHNAWTMESFAWHPAEETPQAIRKLSYTTDQIVGTRGYLSFKKGKQTVTFQYQSGNHRLNIVGVDVCRLDGTVATSDYHYGYTGSAKSRNVYTLDIPEQGIYLVRYFMEVKTETIHSSGTITYSGKVDVPVVVRDLAPGSAPKAGAPIHAVLPHSPSTQRSLSTHTLDEGDVATDTWTPSTWKLAAAVPSRINELGWTSAHVYNYEQPLTLNSRGALHVEFTYKSGNNRLDLCGVDLIDEAGNAVTYDYHNGYTGHAKDKNLYTLAVPYAGAYTLRCFVTNAHEALTSSGDIRLNLVLRDTLHLPAATTTPILGTWSRNTTLAAGRSWEVSAVVGLIAPGQVRRSFLAYNERERAVPWRAMPAYISWYELNIDRNNDPNYTGNMHDTQCNEVVRQWKKQLFDRYGEHINSFVWDDGWDHYGTWTFNLNFPDGFKESDRLAREMGSGIGAWLGPVGGYGQSGNYRRQYWAGKGGMQLSNPAYYKVFTDAIVDLCKNRGYDFRFFKFDGISAQFSAVGPDPGTVGEENAEGIISAERMVRRDVKEDIFFNTTVGTWASPFWFNVTDAVWRQEGDFGKIGVGDDREQWITYRDRLVYQNFVQNSPLCPINTLMTHGFILSKHGQVSKTMNYPGILRELRCAFACGSGMVELYNDYELMNSINGGRLWADLAECLRWQRANADVLPDIHWVGGSPWDGSKANVYGWASWNGKKATFTLRNPANSPQTYKTTLRAALEIPTYLRGAVTLNKAFANQPALKGLNEGTPIDIDAELTLTLPAHTVYIYDGTDATSPTGIADAPAAGTPRNVYHDLAGRRLAVPPASGVYLHNGQKQVR